MKQIVCSIVAVAAIFASHQLLAQNKSDSTRKVKNEIVISNHGISIHSADSTAKAAEKKKKDSKFNTNMSMDLGYNFLQDNTDYNSAAVKNYLHVPASQQNSKLFSLSNKSINVNLYITRSYRALKTAKQQIFLYGGLGLQLYNFRYENNITYQKGTAGLINDTVSFKKNKLAFDFLNIPLGITFKTRIAQNEKDHKKDRWLVYGAGVTGGYAVSIWTKQKSSERGKMKLHDDFGFNQFNSCVSAEIGIDDVIRFYATYQLTNLYNNVGLEQHPIAIGIRISGI